MWSLGRHNKDHGQNNNRRHVEGLVTISDYTSTGGDLVAHELKYIGDSHYFAHPDKTIKDNNWASGKVVNR